jgi:hypothetical protein
MKLASVATVVAVAVTISVSAVVGVWAVLPSPATPANGVAAVCPGGMSRGLSPGSPVLLSQGAVYPTGLGNLCFSVDSPVTLQGSWSSSGSVALAVFSLPFGLTTCPTPGSFATSGALNQTLFPGTYAMVFVAGSGGSLGPSLTVTQTILANFDLGLSVVQSAGTLSLGAGGYVAWPLSVPALPSSVWFNGSLASTACSTVLAVLTASQYEAFQANQSEIYAAGVFIINGYRESPCPSTQPYQDMGGGVYGPLGLAPGGYLVLLNAGPSLAQVEVQHSLEFAYPLSS